MTWFLKAKHWQLFVLSTAIPFGLQFFTVFSMFNAGGFPSFGWLFALVMLFFVGTLMGWFWSIATGLQRNIPAEAKPNLRRFKFFFAVPLVYLTFLILFMGWMMSGGAKSNFNPAVFAVVVPLHLFSMFCMFYCLYFTAKTLKTAEMQHKVSFADFVGEFFTIWFFPIGVWFIQPRVNKLALREEANP